MDTLLLLSSLYCVNITVCAMYHSIAGTRIPYTIWDGVKITFLPYIIYKLIKREEL